ncbi:MAG: pyridine nucleotide-disulfide oxidoreductase [Gammaproteobacteria bacterium]
MNHPATLSQEHAAGASNAAEFNAGIAGYAYADLHQPGKLAELSQLFDAEIKADDPALFDEFAAYRACQGDGMKPEAVSDLLVRMAPRVGAFVAKLFNVGDAREAQKSLIEREMQTIFGFRADIVQKAKSALKPENPAEWDADVVQQRQACLVRLFGETAVDPDDREFIMASAAVKLAHAIGHDDPAEADALVAQIAADTEAARLFASELQAETPLQECLNWLRRWCLLAASDTGIAADVAGWYSFKTPKKTDFDHLVEHDNVDLGGFSGWVGPAHERRRRDGFALTDPRASQRETLYEVDHCIYCHERDTDSCAKGMRNKRAEEGSYKTNPLGVTISGCPLGEKISEMHLIKRQGDNIGALALIIIDNPMCPGTGHRICNDCMKGCIYQKTEPVNIPQIETNVLTDVLFMPWGFEIYSFLTRWNPLNVKRPYALPYNGKNVLTVGMGPAGYTLSHYLLNEGFGVVGIDALKIEPLPAELVGDRDNPPQPIHDFRDLYEALDKRSMLGFGGVAEYGITVRWDKNFLKVIYLNLLRRHAFRCYGGVRFGGTLSIEEAWELGFDHIAIASGAGQPTIIGLKNNLIRGIRKASDFLMGLQLTGAAKTDSLANLQVRLPAGVIGGGLTGIDTTTEVMAYYPIQVEKTLNRYKKLVAEADEATVRSRYDAEELGILDEFLDHGRAIRAERKRAADAGETPDFATLVNGWGGVTMFYRKGMHDSPAYRQNHEEIAKALEEGIRLAEGMSPLEAIADSYDALQAVKFEKLVQVDGKWTRQDEVEVPLKSLFVAAGTSPNTIYQQEHPDTFQMDAKFFQRYEPKWSDTDDLPELVPMADAAMPKIGQPAPLTSYQKDGKFISFYGDNHPVYAGNVVKAMASAKDGYPYVTRLFERELANLDPAAQEQREQALTDLHQRLDEGLQATVVEVKRLTPTIIEVIVKAPMQASKFHPGQFYRVQNLEQLAPVVEDTRLVAEGLALTGAWVDKEQGLISLITLEMGSSSRLCALWQPGEQLVVMGVTGEPTEILKNQTVMLVGGGLGNAVQFSIGKALRAAGSRVIYFAGYKHPEDLFKVSDIEAASDIIVWAVDPGPGVKAIPTTRPQDKTFVGNILEAMVAYASGELGEPQIPLNEVDRMIVIGSDRMMAAVKAARHSVLEPWLNPAHTAIGSINSPMQCMMKGVCAQCLCKHIDPDSGKEYFVYSCYNQDQDLERVDFPNLNARLRQNSVQEKLSNQWLDYLFRKSGSADRVNQV